MKPLLGSCKVREILGAEFDRQNSGEVHVYEHCAVLSSVACIRLHQHTHSIASQAHGSLGPQMRTVGALVHLPRHGCLQCKDWKLLGCIIVVKATMAVVCWAVPQMMHRVWVCKLTVV